MKNILLSFDLRTAMFMLLCAVTSLTSHTKCEAQNLSCDEVLAVEYDSISKNEIIRAQRNIIISNDGGKTGFEFFALLMDSTFILSIKTVGAGTCVKEADPVQFDFADGSKLTISQMGKFNCEGKSSFHFNEQFNNLDLLEALINNSLTQVTVWTKQKSLTRTVSKDVALKIQHLMACFNSSKGPATFSNLLSSVIYSTVDIQPEYDGGYVAMLDFIKRNLRYPAWARRSGADGTVYVEFLIRKDGTITEVKTIKSAHPDLDAEAERVIKLMPPWVPGFKNGKPVTVRFVMPIKFKIG